MAIKRIMVLAGGPDQAALIREIKHHIPDSFVVLVDMNSKVVASKEADKHLVISTMDFDRVRQAIKDENIDIILTACGDQPLLTVGILSEEFKLPCYLTKDQLLALTNKKLMKRIMIENDIPTSKYKTFDTIEKIDTEGLSYPLIVKPVDSNGSKGVRKVEKEDDLMEAAKDAISFSISHNIIVEEFVEGEDVSSDFYIVDGKAVHVMDCLSNKYKPDNEIAVIYQSIIPPPLSPKVKERIQDVAQRIAEVYGIDNSPLLIQTIVHGDNFKVIEFSARLGGGAKYKTIETVTGFNVLQANLLSMLGEKPKIKIKNPEKKYSRCHLYTTGGTLKSIIGLEESLSSGLIEDYVIIRTPGSSLSSPKSSGDRVGSVLVSGENMEELGNKIRKVIDSIRVINEDGKDILLREMYSNTLKNAFGF